MKHREFIYTGEPIKELNKQEHAAFLMHLQKSVLFSLEKRNLLTTSQRERCFLALQKEYNSDNTKKEHCHEPL